MARRLGEDARTANVPILVPSVLDVHRLGDDAPRCIAGYLVKPFKPSRIEAAVAEIVGPHPLQEVK